MMSPFKIMKFLFAIGGARHQASDLNFLNKKIYDLPAQSI